MGFTITIDSNEQFEHITRYILHTLAAQYSYDEEEKVKEVVNNAVKKYSGGNDREVKAVCIQTTDFGTLFTVVVDSAKLTNDDGVLSWVENLDCPDCSELGYTFFEKDTKSGRVRRYA